MSYHKYYSSHDIDNIGYRLFCCCSWLNLICLVCFSLFLNMKIVLRSYYNDPMCDEAKL